MIRAFILRVLAFFAPKARRYWVEVPPGNRAERRARIRKRSKRAPWNIRARYK